MIRAKIRERVPELWAEFKADPTLTITAQANSYGLQTASLRIAYVRFCPDYFQVLELRKAALKRRLVARLRTESTKRQFQEIKARRDPTLNFYWQLTLEQRTYLLEAFEANVPMRAIGRDLGIGHYTLSSWLRKHFGSKRYKQIVAETVRQHHQNRQRSHGPYVAVI